MKKFREKKRPKVNKLVLQRRRIDKNEYEYVAYMSKYPNAISRHREKISAVMNLTRFWTKIFRDQVRNELS